MEHPFISRVVQMSAIAAAIGLGFARPTLARTAPDLDTLSAKQAVT